MGRPRRRCRARRRANDEAPRATNSRLSPFRGRDRHRRSRQSSSIGKSAGMTRYSTLTQLDTDWIVSWAKRVNEDRVLKVIGRFFTANFVIGIDDKDFYIQVRNGKIEMVAEEPNANLMGWQFALRAPASSWSKFVEPVPPPMY